ncbi:hypothetical protein C8J56DRAFT_1094686 [Mycena floridula]|nr:hypothetical protein C8J56DRAFT_1094686 [Mycena floridula]
MSLESSLVKDEPNARRLLDIIAMLPSGTTLDTLQQYWAPNMENLDSALEPLLEASLLECQSTTYFVLPVIRSYLLDPSRLPSDVHESMVAAACYFLQQHQTTNPGEPSFIDDMKARANEEINLQFILLDTSESNPEIIEALDTLAWHQLRVRPRLEVIKHAVKLISQLAAQRRIGHVLNLYAVILRGLTHFHDSIKQYKLARDAYLAASEPAHAALTLLRIADTSVLIDQAFNDTPLIEQAQQEFESIYSPHPIPNEYIVNCLRRLGRAHSRSGNHFEAVEHLREARDLSAEGSFDRAKCIEDLAKAYHRLGQFNEAEKWAVEAVNQWREMGANLEYTLRVLGMIYISRSKYNEAINCLKKGLDSAKARGNLQRTADILLELGRAQMKKGNGDDA